jgi:hydrophobic/amphiphilic exporter-1 (mainly G- bacteria), HAE1 family
MLIGIVVTNAIVLLDLVERLRAQGMSTKEALIEGGRTRVRPILMTAIATILALLPLAAGFSKGSIIAAELGTVVIGGLLSSTFLTLLVIPVIYSLVDSGKTWASRRLGRGTQGEAPATLETTPVTG